MIDDLLSARRIEPLSPEPGAAEAAWAEVGRRRGKRILRTQVAAGVGLVLVVMVGLLPSLDEGGRVAKLDVAGRETNQARTPRPPSRLAPEVDVTPEVVGGREPGRADAPTGTPSATATAPVPAPARPGASAPVPGRTRPPLERSRYGSLSIGCFQWCLGARVVPGEEAYGLSLDLCVAVGGGTRRFNFATTQEADLRVATSAPAPETLWTWSLGQQFPAREHYVDIASGECVRWTAMWDGTDEAGEPLPSGTYRLFATSLAEEVGQRPAETTFRIP